MAPVQREPGQKGVNWSNIAVGAIMNMFVRGFGVPCAPHTDALCRRSQPWASLSRC
ncbi:hypothetical protein JB92DRAFT_2854480 [Gautieria morchelliformis]|nr:hypothetical protein JB92DRAFT_2854480 [Gautieria morchelliformis]